MPLLSITTNVALATNQSEELTQSASTLVAEMLGKPERYVMVRLACNPAMLFAGTRQPTVYAELKSLGLAEDKTKQYSKQLCDLFSDQLGVESDRVYIEFANAERHMWGWNGSTF